MKCFFVLLFAALTLAATNKATCKGTYYKTTSALNVRVGAGTQYAVKRILANHASVCVISIKGDWAKLDDGNYVSKKYIKKTGFTCHGPGDDTSEHRYKLCG